MSEEILTFKEDFIGIYTFHHKKAMNLLLTLIHLTSGMPARATEVCGMKLKNFNGLRNVFFMDGNFSFYSTMNKTNTLTGSGKPIFRFLPPILRKQFSAMILLVRPFFAQLQLQVMQLDG